MTEPEQWAVELLEAVHDASDMGSACGMVDCPQCKAAALTIQRTFEERERKLREALTTIRDYHKDYEGSDYAAEYYASIARQALTTRQDAPKASEDTSHDQ